MSVSIGQFSFTGGEWMPGLEYRTDLDKYMTSVMRMENFIAHKHGETSNRPGLEFTCETKNSAKKSRQIPFQFSVIQSYFLLFSDQNMRVVKDGGLVVSPMTVSGAADNGSGLVRITTSTAHGFATGNTVTVSGVVGTTEANGTWIITVTASDKFDLVGSTFANTYIGGGTATAIVEIATPWTEADLPLLKYKQSADTIYFTHPSYNRYKLTRTSHTAWVLTPITAGASIDAPTNLTGGTGSGRVWAVTALTEDGIESLPSNTRATAVSNTLTWDAVSNASEYNVYEVVNGIYQYVGRAGTASYALPGTVTADDTISAPQAVNPFPTAGQYPGCSAFYKQRLLFARTNEKPKTIWGSRIGDFENNNRSSPPVDDGPFSATIDSGYGNEILWMEALNDLIVGMTGEEYKFGSADNSVNAFKADFQSAWGVCNIPPIKIGNSLVFVDGSERTVRDLTFSLELDGYAGNDLSVLAQHLFVDSKVLGWCYAKYPDSILWAWREDGVACGLTYVKEHLVVGWCRLVTDGVIEDMAAIQTGGATTEVSCIVKRTINGQTKRYVERLHERNFTAIEDAFFVDCGLTYDGTEATIISGLDHLEGCSVVALADGNVVKDLTVTDGQITLPVAASKVHVGLPYTARLKTHGFSYPTQSGTGQDKIRTVTGLSVFLRNTRGMWAGSRDEKLYEQKFRTDEEADEPTRLFTGKKEISIDPSPLGDARVCIEMPEPLPITIQGIVPRVSAGS